MEQTEKTFEKKVLEARKLIASLASSPVEQHAIAAGALHHFDFKLRMVEMERKQPQAQMSLNDAIKLEDGESLVKHFEIKFTADIPEKAAPKDNKEWVAQEGKGKLMLKRVKKAKPKKSKE